MTDLRSASPDIPAQRMLQNKVPADAQLLRTVWETAADAMALSDPDGRVIAVNPAYVRLYGYPEEELVGQSFAIIFPEERRAEAVEQYRAVFNSPTIPPRFESIVQRADGVERSVESRIDFIEEHGQRLAMLSTIRDISERRAAEDELRQNEERFRLAIHDSPITVFEQDQALRYVWLHNPRAGFELDSMLGKTDDELFSPEDATLLTAVKQHVLATGQPERKEVRVATPAGLAYFDLHIHPRRDRQGRIIGITCASTDITQRKEAEDKGQFLAQVGLLVNASLEYTALMERLARLMIPRLGDWCIIYVCDEEGQLRREATAHVDPAQEPLLVELTALPLDPHQNQLLQPVIATGEGLLVPNLTTWLPEESQRGPQMAVVRRLGLGSGMAIPLRARGVTLGVITVAKADPVHPLTPADLALGQEFANRAALYVDNALLYQQAQAAIHVRDEFLSIASHELRTPLTSLTLLSHFFHQLSRDSISSETVKARLTRMADSNTRQLKRLSHLIDDLLDVSRIAAGRLTLKLEEVDLAAVAREVVERSLDDAALAGSPITLDAPTPVVGYWDSFGLDQALTNLVSNAIKYGAGKPIEVSIQGNATGARVMVRDQGIGIADKDIGRIFERFERAGAARHIGGVGLGLYITHQIIEAHGGKIWVNSVVGAGSVFNVELPSTAPDPGETTSGM